jgi:hypothetical protein
MQLNHIKRFNRQIFIEANAMAPEEEDKFVKAVDGAIIRVNGDPATKVMPCPYPPIQTDMYAIENRIDMDREKISGQSSYQQGVAAQTKTRTAEEVSQISSGTFGRSAEKQDIVEEFTEEIANKIVNLAKQFYDKDRYLSIAGVEVAEKFLSLLQSNGKFDGTSISYTKDDIQGDYSIDIVAGSTLPLDPQKRLNNLLLIAKAYPAFGLNPGSLAASTLGMATMDELEEKEVREAFKQDIDKLQQEPKPDPEKQMKLIQMKQSIDKNVADKALKTARTTSTNLRNVHQAIANGKEMSVETFKPEDNTNG